MASNTRSALNRHRKFEQDSIKYVIDLESRDIIQVNDIEWDILDFYGTHTDQQIVEELKPKYKITSIFQGIESLEQLRRQGFLLRIANQTTLHPEQTDRIPKFLVPAASGQDASSHDIVTRMNRHQLLKHIAKLAKLETLNFSKMEDGATGQRLTQDLDTNFSIQHIDVEDGHTRAASWYTLNQYDGILLLSQDLTDELPYYQVHHTPIVHFVENTQNGRNTSRETLLNLYAHQKEMDTLVVNASWLKIWLDDFKLPKKRIHVIHDGITPVEPIGKALAKQHTAALLDNPLFAQQPIVGLISGFESNAGADFLFTFAESNPDLAVFAYDPLLADQKHNLPENLAIFSAKDPVTRVILSMFFEAFDLVCFPAIPGTPFSLVLDAMAYGTPCIALSQYGIPEEVKGAGVAVTAEYDGLGHFYVPLSVFSETVKQWLKPSEMRAKSEKVAQNMIHKYTWEKAAQEILHLFADAQQSQHDSPRTTKNIFPPIFCRNYEPGANTSVSLAYQTRSEKYGSLENALAETLTAHHTQSEIEFVFKHFQRKLK